ncbi:MAG: RsmE family RNA methyltransferase [Candidatus Paceibacterota bacterium]
MKIHRFIDNFDLSKDELEINGQIAHQIINVLKLKIGEKIELSDGKHISVIAHICKIDKKNVSVKIEKILEKNNKKQNNKKVNLFCCILKKENFELIVQKSTECGVSSIIPIISDHTVKTGINIERLKKIAKEASEQSGRVDIPEINEIVYFNESLKLIKENNLNILFDSSGELFLKEHTPDSSNNSEINIWIGPEGGWSNKEIEKAKELNFKIMSLGPLTLRGETAAIVATYLIKNLE